LYADAVFPTDTDYCETFGHDLVTGGTVTETEHRAMNPAGRAFLKGAPYTPAHELPSDDYPLLYTTGRTVYHFHTRTKTGRSRDLNDAAPDAWVELSQADADERGITEGDWVRVESPRGAIEVRARVGNVMTGAVFAPFHYGHWEPETAPDSGADQPEGHRDANHRLANELTMTVWDPVSKQPTFKTAACQVTRTRDGEGPAPAPTTADSVTPTSSRSEPRATAGGSPTSSRVLPDVPHYPLDPAQGGR
jgi:anaerobic selenocysteine-containing dehydrogenase